MTYPIWRECEGLEFSKVNQSADFDVLIVGGGYSGLWSAFHLLDANSSLRIAICEAKSIGFGASGRNGGWASTEYPVSRTTLRKRYGVSAIAHLERALSDSIKAIGQFATLHAPGTNFVKSGTVTFARNDAQLKRLNASEDAGVWISGEELGELIKVNGALGGRFNPECATIQPFELLVGLARYLVSKGVQIFTNTEAKITKNSVFANSHKLTAPVIVNATEAFGENPRSFIPLYSLMVATEPLPEDFWRIVGNHSRFTFAEFSHLINYAQRTADNRLAIGGRGATYPYGSNLKIKKESTARVHEQIRNLAHSWFPALRDFRFTHAWGGPVAITRDWEPYVQWDPKVGLGRLGGYAGDGVTLSYLASKILSEEILEIQSDLRSLHFVNREIRRWEPEPIRYIGVNALVKLSGIADKEERLTGRASLLNRVIEPLILR